MNERPELPEGMAQSDQADKPNCFEAKTDEYRPAHTPMSESMLQAPAMVCLTYEQLQTISNAIVDLHEIMQNPEYLVSYKKAFNGRIETMQEQVHQCCTNAYLSLEAKAKAEN
jgi:hypothetical protein